MKYLKNPMFNLTSILKHARENNNLEVLNLFNHINYSEHSEINIMDGNDYSTQYKLAESLGENFLNFLPLDYYKEFISLDWVNIEKNDDSIVKIAFRQRKYDFILHFTNVLFNSISKEYDEKIYHYLNREFMNFFDIKITTNHLHNLSRSKTNKSLEYVTFINDIFNLYVKFNNQYREDKIESIKTNSIIEIINKLKFDKFGMSEIYDTLVSQETLFDIYKIESSKSKKLLSPLYLKQSIENDNLSVINLIMKDNNLSIDNYSLSLVNQLETAVSINSKNNSSADYIPKYSDKIKNHLSNVKLNYSDKDYANFYKDIKRYIVLNEDVILDENEKSIFTHFLNKEVYIAHLVMSDYVKEHDIKMNTNLSYLISEKVLNNIKEININDIDHQKSIVFIKNYFSKNISSVKNAIPIDTYFMNKLLHYTIPNKELNPKKNKI